MIEPIVVKQRDSYSIETKFRYTTDPARKTGIFAVQVYFFLPAVFEVNPTTYDSRALIDQLRVRLRFNSPAIDREELLDRLSEVSPLVRIERMIKSAERGDQPLDWPVLVHESKLLGCVYKSLLRDFYVGLQMRGGVPLSDVGSDARRLLQVAKRFHALRNSLIALIDPTDTVARRHVDIVDEHLSLLVGKYFLLILRLWGSAEANDDYRMIARSIQKEERYREVRGYHSVPALIRSEPQFEEYVYREKMLKHYVTEALLFSVNRTNTAKRTEHLLYAIAAGTAMVIATGVAFFGQQRFGNFTTTLFVLLVLGYMVKDRVKESFRAMLLKRIGTLFPVRKTVLRDARTRRRLATLSERTGFREDRHMPADVVALRNRGYFERVVFSRDTEAILAYRKRIRLHDNNFDAIHSRVTGVADITTVDIRPLIRRLGEQYGLVPVVHNKRHVEPVVVKRIYHLNMIIAFSHGDERILRRYRLIVDAGGIKRLERVAADQTTHIVPMRIDPSGEAPDDGEDE